MIVLLDSEGDRWFTDEYGDMITCGIIDDGYRWTNSTWTSTYFKIENVEYVERLKI